MRLRTEQFARKIGVMPLLEDLSRPLSTLSFISLDTETTGLSCHYCELVEVAAIRFRPDGVHLDRYEQLIDPGCPIPYSAAAVHGITDDMVRGKPQVRQVIPELFDFLTREPAILLIHNAAFDMGFLRAAARRAGVLCPAIPVVDTLGLCRKLLRDMRSHRLDLLAARFCGRSRADHRAAGDAAVLITVFHELLRRAGSPQTLAEFLQYARVRCLSGEEIKSQPSRGRAPTLLSTGAVEP